MNLSDIITKCFILALFIRDDGERLLLGDGFYEFKDTLQHFAPNIYQNDVIELQGTDGQLLAGQVRRGAMQSFDGYIADATTSREATEEHRQRFLAFFRKKHHYKVVYVFPNGDAVKRERGYIVDAPAVQEMYQRFPEYHVGLNFEDVNYYEYSEGEDGDEIFAHVQSIAINAYIEGGLVWDSYGAVTNEVTWVDYVLKNTTDGYAQITDGVAGAPLSLTHLYGNAEQNGTPTPDAPIPIKTVTGAQTVKITGKNLFDCMAPYRTGGTFYNLPVGTQIVSEQSSSVAITQTSNGCTIAVPSWGGAVFVIPLQVGKTYHLKYTLTSSSNRMSRYTLDSDHKVVRQLGNLTTNPISEDINVSLQNGEAYFAIAFGSNSAITLTLTEPQLELGNTATTYAPYQAQSQEIAIDKNLAILPLFQMGGMTNGVLTTSNFRTTNANNPVTVKPNTKYTASVELHNAVLGFRVGIHECAEDGTFIRDLGWKQIGTDPFTMTTGPDCYKVKIVCTLSTTSTVVTTGSTEDTTPFTSAEKWFRGCIFRFNEGETVAPTIELAGVGQIQSDGLPQYHDSFKRVDGVWYIHKEVGKVVLDGTEWWGDYTQQVAGFYNGYSTTKKWGHNGGSFAPIGDFMSDHFQSSGTYFFQSTQPQNLASTEYACYCHISSSIAPDSATLKTWLSTHNTTVYYVLATPTDTVITDTDLLAQLNAIASTYDGVNNITITPSAGAQGELEVRYSRGFIPVGAGYVWDVPSGAGPNVVSVDGIDRTGIVWEVVGPATNPTLTNITTNQTMTFEGDVATGQTLTVNTTDQTASIEGTNVFSQMTGDWLELAAGNNIISYTATGTTEPSTIKWNGVVG